jgi:hypothetical protein
MPSAVRASAFVLYIRATCSSSPKVAMTTVAFSYLYVKVDIFFLTCIHRNPICIHA